MTADQELGFRLYDRNTCAANKIMSFRHGDPTLTACKMKTYAQDSQNARKGQPKCMHRATKMHAHLRNDIIPRLLDQICLSLSFHLLYYHAQLFPHSESYPSSAFSLIPVSPCLSLSARLNLCTVLIFAPYLFRICSLCRILFPLFFFCCYLSVRLDLSSGINLFFLPSHHSIF